MRSPCIKYEIDLPTPHPGHQSKPARLTGQILPINRVGRNEARYRSPAIQVQTSRGIRVSVDPIIFVIILNSYKK
jgi:hypothetical protein